MAEGEHMRAARFININRRLLALLATFGIGAFGFGLVQHVLADTSTVYYACVKNDGTIRMVSAGTTCHAHETLISWNQTGPQGPAGPTGPQGPAGSGSGGQLICSNCVFSSKLGSRLQGKDLSGAYLEHISLTGSVDMSGDNFTGAVLASAQIQSDNGNWPNLSNDNFTNADLSGTDFIQSNIANDHFNGANLSNVAMTSPDLSHVDFTGANLSNMQIQDTSLVGVPFSGATLVGFSMRNVAAAGVNFSGFDMTNTGMVFSDFSGAHFANANLSNGFICQNNFSHADFTNANLSDAFTTCGDTGPNDLTGATWSNTTCPDHSNSNDNGGTCEGHF